MPKFPTHYNNLTISKVANNSFFYLLDNFARNFDKSVIFVAANDVEANNIHNILVKIKHNYEVLLLPAWDCLPYDRVSPNLQIISQRVKTLNELLVSKKRIIVTTVNAFLLKLIPKEILKEHFLKLKLGEDYKIKDIAAYLVANSYQHVSVVNEAGEFSIKGSIVDIYPFGQRSPVRIDFFADKIDVIKEFDPITQISISKITELEIIPAGEVILNDNNIANFRENYRKYFEIDYGNDDFYDKVSNKIHVAGIEHWLPLFYKQELVTLKDYVADAVIIHDNNFLQAVTERIEAINDYYKARNSALQVKNHSEYNPIQPDLLYLNLTDVNKVLLDSERVIFNNFADNASYAIEFDIKKTPNFYEKAKIEKINSTKLAYDFLISRKEFYPKIKIYFVANSNNALSRFKNLWEHHLNEFREEKENIKNININYLELSLDSGFYDTENIYITEHDLYGFKAVKAKSNSRKSEKIILEASSLSVGEYIVHKEHGIGKFLGLKLIKVADMEHEFVSLLYDADNKLYLPVENLDLLSKYGNQSDIIRLDKLGSHSFLEKRARLKKKIRDIAEGLIKLASKREMSKSQPVIFDDNLLTEFSLEFEFDETEDQINAINDVKKDFESGKIIDRLICGDVGFGKTEIAIRASFMILTALNLPVKPQIAIIVPTTLLARQHYNNFKKRFAKYDFEIRQLSRMEKQSSLKKTREDLSSGKVDIVIGTHSLLAKNIEFKNLALAILDEEQHFGVVQKEKIKNLRENIHILSLSATPIPRTLQMSLSGIRDLSLLTTPPIDRMAVRSFVMPFDSVVIRDAILREYHRGGNIFYVCPRIKDLEKEAEKIRKLIPEIKFKMAHGGLKSDELDQIMNDFCDKKFDLLLSTSIVESGIDISTANTIIIHHADKFGLAQLYQLRGRVGRSKIRAYAYFTFDPKKSLTELADKRLKVMQTLDGLGAGFSLASHDMDIRGAGNLLGEEQSGHVKEVGVELYQNMLNEAVMELKSEKLFDSSIEDHDFSPEVNIGLPVLIPESYIEDINLRVEFYRRIANLANRDEADDLILELEDRFGNMPEETKNLLAIIEIKNKAKEIFISKLEAGPKAIMLKFAVQNKLDPANIMKFIANSKWQIKLKEDNKMVFIIENHNANRVQFINDILNDVGKI